MFNNVRRTFSSTFLPIFLTIIFSSTVHAQSWEAVKWQSHVNTVADYSRGTSSSLSCTRSGSTAWVSDAVSVQTFGGNGAIRWKFKSTDAPTIVGLQRLNSSRDFRDADFAIYGYRGGKLLIFEKGSSIVNAGTFTTSDLFEIARTGSRITYKKNGRIIHTSAKPSGGNLMVDVATNDGRGGVNLAQMSRVGGDDGGATWSAINWTDLVRTTTSRNSSGSIVTRQSQGNSVWNSDAVSASRLSGSGAIRWKFTGTNSPVIVGLQAQNSSRDYKSISFGIYGYRGGKLMVMESGRVVKEFGTFTTSDILSIDRIAEKVHYRKNGKIFYTSTKTSRGVLMADVAMNSDNSGIVAAQKMGFSGGGDTGGNISCQAVKVDSTRTDGFILRNDLPSNSSKQGTRQWVDSTCMAKIKSAGISIGVMPYEQIERDFPHYDKAEGSIGWIENCSAIVEYLEGNGGNGGGGGPVTTTTTTSTTTTTGRKTTTTTTSSSTTTTTPDTGAAKAFPGAFGHGAFKRNWSNAKVMVIDKFTDSNPSRPGEFRHAVMSTGPRILVFKTGGNIKLTRQIDLKAAHSNLYIAGQTAQGGGIMVTRNWGTSGGQNLIRMRGISNVIFRYVRFRGAKGSPGSGDMISALESNGIIYDHLSVSWSNDENIGFWNDYNSKLFNITVQNSLLGEPLAPHATNMLFNAAANYNASTRNWDAHIKEMKNFSIHRNIFTHATHRNPMMAGTNAIVANNISFDWSEFNFGFVGRSQIDYKNNYLVEGPTNNSRGINIKNPGSYINVRQGMFLDKKNMPQNRYSLSDPNEHLLLPGSVYLGGNWLKRYRSNITDGVYDEWSKVVERVGLRKNAFPCGSGATFTCLTKSRRTSPLRDNSPHPYKTVAANQTLVNQVLAEAGASKRLDCSGNWIAARDKVDARYVSDIKAQKLTFPIPTTPAQVGGHPNLAKGSACADADRDGMPDAFESRYNLNRGSNDALADADRDGYTNLEEYLNGTNPRK